jgi:histidinol-phosphate/aromatic aminotransferase/cobyric acid decarboxylase-like protein
MGRHRVTICVAGELDREAIYRIRHEVYASELAQHSKNPSGRLTDPLDGVNTYLVAKVGSEVAGFVSITPPGSHGLSLDKYFSRDKLPFPVDERLYEVRLLTVVRSRRGAQVAMLLMYGAYRLIESLGGRAIAGIGRLEVLDMYRRAGLRPLGLRTRSGEVTYELMFADLADLRTRVTVLAGALSRLEHSVDWQLGEIDFWKEPSCHHGGAFFEAIGEDFETLDRQHAVINADVLDAWFDPAPSVSAKLLEYLTFAIRTSPPASCEGMRRAVARARGVGREHVLPGAGSSDLIFAGLKLWVTRHSRVLILDPMYGEYAHVLKNVIGARVDRLTLSSKTGYSVNPNDLSAALQRGYDWVVLVNPNSPTGRHISRRHLESLLSATPARTRVWVDETYVDYAGHDQSLEAFAAQSSNVVVCKSMSKAYALSGVRAAYLCGPAGMIDDLQGNCPPWSVSLPGQIAACEALRARDYYAEQWEQTRVLRWELATALRGLGWKVVPGCANFLLCLLPLCGPSADAVVRAARTRGLFVRDVSNMGTTLGDRALRVAVKDRATNAAIVRLLKLTLSELSRYTASPMSAGATKTTTATRKRVPATGTREVGGVYALGA